MKTSRGCSVAKEGCEGGSRKANSPHLQLLPVATEPVAEKHCELYRLYESASGTEFLRDCAEKWEQPLLILSECNITFY